MGKKNKKQLIIRAGAQLFKDKGYTAASIRDLSKVVGLQPSSMYNHIQNKEEILQFICFDYAHKFTTGIQTIIDTADTSVVQKIEALIDLHLHIATNDPISAIVFHNEWKHLTDPHLTDFIQLRKDYESKFRSLIEAGIEEGLFKNINASVIVFSLLSSIQWIYDWYKPSRKIGIDELAADFKALVLNGLLTTPA